MNIKAIDDTIKALCEEVSLLPLADIGWEEKTEEELLYELVFCVLSSQMLFEVSIAAVERLKSRQLLNIDRILILLSDYIYGDMIRFAFSEPLSVTIRRKEQKVMMRFRNRISTLLASTMERIYGKGHTIKQILQSAESAQNARELMMLSVSGFGPKQASLFLRKIGYCTELAVLDTHVVDYLKMAKGMEIKISFLSRLPSYEKIEGEFLKIASNFGHSVGCVDLAVWVTMRVAKREYAI